MKYEVSQHSKLSKFDSHIKILKIIKVRIVDTLIVFVLIFYIPAASFAQQRSSSPFDATRWGVVLDHPRMHEVVVQKDVPYMMGTHGQMGLDLYFPPKLKKGEKRPVIVFMNTFGDEPGKVKIKDYEIYKTWPALLAANGYIGISMESDRSMINDCLKNVFEFVRKQGVKYNIDTSRIGVYAGGSNAQQSLAYLMSEHAYSGIKAVAIYYGGPTQGPFRKDLPVLFVVPEGDVNGDAYATTWTEVLKNKAPWRIVMASELNHAFDAFSDTDKARRIVKETISFWNNQLEPIPPVSWKYSLPREALSVIYGNDMTKAASLLEQWLKDNPEDIEALIKYSDVLRNSRRYPEAETVYKKLVPLHPKNAVMLNDLVTVLNAQRKWKESEAFISEGIQTGLLNNAAVYSRLGSIQFAQEKFQEGITSFSKAIQLWGDQNAQSRAVAFFNMAGGYAKLNNKDLAFESLSKAIALGSISKERIENEKMLEPLRQEERYIDLIKKLK